MKRTIASVAKAAGVTVRTLHHYDHIGLLRPSGRAANGYRSYSREDVERLQFILLLRQLELSLDDIRAVLERPDFDRRAALEQHLSALRARHRRLGSLVRVLERAIASHQQEKTMSDEGLFDGLRQAQHTEEAKQRWGHTPAWKDSQRRLRNATKADHDAWREEALAAARGVAAHMAEGAGSAEVQRFVRAHHEHIDRRYYACSVELYDQLAQLWVEDARFTAWWDAVKPGLATFMRQAVDVYVREQLLEEERR